jgi:hypothetical protein
MEWPRKREQWASSGKLLRWPWLEDEREMETGMEVMRMEGSEPLTGQREGAKAAGWRHLRHRHRRRRRQRDEEG